MGDDILAWIKERSFRIFGRIYTLSRKKMIAASAAVFSICLIVGAIRNNSATSAPIAALSTALSPASEGLTAEPAAQETPEPSKILIHVAGAVKEPGLIRLAPDARIIDGILAAGGALEAADIDSLNLASPVYDGMKLYVPRIGETPAVLPPATPEGGIGALPASAKININTAGVPELTALNGIGEATAKKILAYRKEHGKFQKPEDLLQVSGIGNAKYEAIRDQICV